MRGEIYEADDLVPAVRVSDGRRVRVPAAWLEEGHVFGGTYRKPEDEAEAAPSLMVRVMVAPLLTEPVGLMSQTVPSGYLLLFSCVVTTEKPRPESLLLALEAVLPR